MHFTFTDTLLRPHCFRAHRYTMRCPDGCEPEVHEKAMLPCWRADPATRPGFAALMETIVDLGAVPPAADVLSRTRTQRNSAKRATKNTKRTAANKPQGNVRQLLGPSVHHITMVLAPKVIKAVRPPWKDKRGKSVNPPEAATIAHAVQAVVKPHGAEKISPRDGIKGAAYVDTLSSKDDVGMATALLSCELSHNATSIAFFKCAFLLSLQHSPQGRTYAAPLLTVCHSRHDLVNR
jgi:hypothetical protein